MYAWAYARNFGGFKECKKRGSKMSAEGAATIVGWKFIGGLAGVGAIGAGLASLVVMCTMTPRSPKEWAVGLTSTVVGSICGGSAVVQHFGLHEWAQDYIGMMALLGIVFACGLPAWAIVRWVFNYIAKKNDAGIDEVVDDVKKRMTP